MIRFNILEEILEEKGFRRTVKEFDGEYTTYYYKNLVKDLRADITEYEGGEIIEFFFEIPDFKIVHGPALCCDERDGIHVGVQGITDDNEVLKLFRRSLEIQGNTKKYRLEYIQKYLELEKWMYEELDPVLENNDLVRTCNLTSEGMMLERCIYIGPPEGFSLFEMTIDPLTFEIGTDFGDEGYKMKVSLFGLTSGFIQDILEDITK